MDSILQGLVEEHKKKLERNNGNGQQDFIDALLSVVDGSNPNLLRENPDTIIKSTCLQARTPQLSCSLGLSLLLNNRHVLKKVQDELDEHVDRERQVAETDTKDLVYLHAIIREAMRLYPGIPVFVRESVTDCVIAGYHIPAHTRLMINLTKLQKDPKVWPNPTEFIPERFLTSHKNVDPSGKHFELIPFHSG
ncbi:Cytochrome P450 CYP82D47-like protein [Drosera capensis]